MLIAQKKEGAHLYLPLESFFGALAVAAAVFDADACGLRAPVVVACSSRGLVKSLTIGTSSESESSVGFQNSG